MPTNENILKKAMRSHNIREFEKTLQNKNGDIWSISGTKYVKATGDKKIREVRESPIDMALHLAVEKSDNMGGILVDSSCELSEDMLKDLGFEPRYTISFNGTHLTGYAFNPSQNQDSTRIPDNSNWRLLSRYLHKNN